MKSLWLLMVALCLAVTVSAREATNSPEQISIEVNPNSGFSVNPIFSVPVGQSFTAVSANIEWIGMVVSSCIAPMDFRLDLLEGAGTSGALVSSQTATAESRHSGFLYFDFSGTTLTVGSQYTVVFSQVSPTPMGCTGASIGGTENKYSGGIAYIQAEPATGFDADFYLRVLTAMFVGQIEPPLSATGNLTFKAGRVLPIRFTLTVDGLPTCDLPPAEITVASYAGKERPPFLLRDTFGIAGCNYIYRLNTKSLASGLYHVSIALKNSEPDPLTVGSAFFTVQ